VRSQPFVVLAMRRTVFQSFGAEVLSPLLSFPFVLEGRGEGLVLEGAPLWLLPMCI